MGDEHKGISVRREARLHGRLQGRLKHNLCKRHGVRGCLCGRLGCWRRGRRRTQNEATGAVEAVHKPEAEFEVWEDSLLVWPRHLHT